QGLGQEIAFRWNNPSHTRGGLYRRCGDCSDAVTAVRRDRLDVGGNSGTGRRIKASDGQHDRRCLGHEGNVSEMVVLAKSLFDMSGDSMCREGSDNSVVTIGSIF